MPIATTCADSREYGRVKDDMSLQPMSLRTCEPSTRAEPPTSRRGRACPPARPPTATVAEAAATVPSNSITFRNFVVANVSLLIQITQCIYSEANASAREMSNLKFSNVTRQKVAGTSQIQHRRVAALGRREPESFSGWTLLLIYLSKEKYRPRNLKY
jgi:hypothetical protein